MIITTTSTIEGKPVRQYMGLVTGEVIVGANLFRDMFAAVRDIVGGRAGGYEKAMKKAREAAYRELVDEATDLGADAVIGVDLDYEIIGKDGSMLMVSVTGTAVKLG